MKYKLCPICLTDDYDLIRNCELRGRYKECSASALLYINVSSPEINEPKQEGRKP